MPVYQALLIPADGKRPTVVPYSGSRADSERYLGGLPERTAYDTDAAMYVNDMGRLLGQPMNMRATEYIKTESVAAQQGRLRYAPADYGLYGPVLIVGERPLGGGDVEMCDVPQRLVEHFTGVERETEKEQ